jgi:4-amino-4-deoxy-L-arabinose transferase-like glycosyltransferase
MIPDRSALLRPSVLLALASLVLHAFANGHYGFFRDELYFIVCGLHPDWGYVDQPALVPLFAAWAHALSGDSVWLFRLLPMLAAAATVAMTAEFTQLIGGGRFAQWLGGLCVLLAPIFLLEGTLFFTDMFQPITWLGLAFVLVKLEQSEDERWWLVFGAVAGFSLNTKYLIIFYLAALAIALLATPRRKSLLRPWVWAGAALAVALALPNILWQQAHGWPFIELGRAGANGKNLAMSPAAFLVQQILQIGPPAALVWAAGLWAGLVRPKPAVACAFPIAWLVLFAVFDASHGKPYYLAPIYPTLLALGAGRIEQWIADTRLRAALLGVIVLPGLLIAPLMLPILPVESFVRYQSAIGFTPSVGERLKQGVLPQYFADMFGWPQMARKIAAVYWSLPPAERAKAAFWGNNYGEAAAIDIFGRQLGLPPALSGHNQYHLWGPQGRDGSVLIIIGGSTKHYDDLFLSHSVAGHIDAPYAMPYETDRPIYVLHGLKIPMKELWSEAKHYE